MRMLVFHYFFSSGLIPLLGMNNIADAQIFASLCHLQENM